MERRLSTTGGEEHVEEPGTAELPRRRPVAMLTHSYYDEDPRVRREAESLVAAGWPVDVYALRRDDDPAWNELDGVSVRRLNVQRHQGAGLGTYLLEYVAFLVRAGWSVTAAHRRRRYALVQVHTLPDFLIAATLPLRLVGVPVLLDLHEAMPEFFRSRFPRAANPLAHLVLRIQERVSIGLASAVVTVNQAMRERLVDLGVRPDKVTVVANSPSLARFDPSRHDARPFAADGTVRLVYAGALTPTYELDVLLEAVAAIGRTRPEVAMHLDVFGRGDAAERLVDQAARLGLEDRVTFHGRIPIDDVPAAVARADIGVAPTRRDPFTDVSLSTKVFEFAAMGKPVVASRLPMVERTFPPNSVATYDPGNPESMAAAILSFVDDGDGREAAVARSAEVVQSSAWERESIGYIALVGRLAGEARGDVRRSASNPS
jgi:glycosyltransferase involved in cell wall biosynthesis